MSSYRKKKGAPLPPTPGWAVYLRTSSEDHQKPELSRARQRSIIDGNVLDHSDLPVIDEYVDVLTGKTPNRVGYQRLLADARAGKFSHVIVERADRFGRNDTEALRAIDELHEFGVAVRFANSPDLDPMDPDDRVLVALSFTLARRESALLGIRTRGGQQAKRKSGGCTNYAPDGYKNVTARTDATKKMDLGRWDKWIEIDPERAPVWRLAWDMLLEDRWTLDEIAEKLHELGYRHRSGRPFIEVKPNRKRRANVTSISHVFHNWMYAGWVVSLKNGIPPKTIRGNWEPIVSTEEFERGIAILERRSRNRAARRKRDYLLKSIISYIDAEGNERKLTCSTSNASRPGGGTAYYCVPRSNVNFMCEKIDAQIPDELCAIQIDPAHLCTIRAFYRQDLAEKLGLARPDERKLMSDALTAIDQEEARMARLLASGKISEDVWNGLWAEWQERRNRLRSNLNSIEQQQEFHIDNLETALAIIAQVGTLYNRLEVSARRELLLHMVKQVVVNTDGEIVLELNAPFAYLKDLSDRAKRGGETPAKMQTSDASDDIGCSDCVQRVSTAGIRTWDPSVNSRLLCR
ncbi:MAG: recombinase family protein [Anaerolinea sp.]|nr:recombinase family protein [Anaerolinea sp.]